MVWYITKTDEHDFHVLSLYIILGGLQFLLPVAIAHLSDRMPHVYKLRFQFSLVIAYLSDHVPHVYILVFQLTELQFHMKICLK